MHNVTEILNQIVQDLVNPAINLNDILLKTKIIAFNLQNQRVKDWVEKELGGYDENEEVPKYRIVPTSVYGDLIQDLPGQTTYSRNALIVFDYTSEKTRNWLSQVKLRFPISKIEHYVIKGTDAHFNVPHHMQEEISRTLSNFWHVQEAWRVTPNSYFVGIISMIKNKLLDFVMELNSTLGDSSLSLPMQQQKVNDIFRHTIGTIQGETVNVNLGNHNNNLNIGSNTNSTVSQNVTHNYSSAEIGQIRELVGMIKAELKNISESQYRERIESELTRLEKEADKSSPMKLIMNSALNIIYELLIEAGGAAYSPIILEKLQMLIH